MNKIITIIICLIFSLFVIAAFLPFLLIEQTQPLGGAEELKAKAENIIYSKIETVKSCVLWKDYASKINYKDVDIDCDDIKSVEQVRYFYITDKVKNETRLSIGNKLLTEDIAKRSKTAKYYKDGNKYIVTISSSQEEYLKDGVWYEIENATTTQENFKEKTKLGLLDRFIRSFTAQADDYYSSSGDGEARYQTANTTTGEAWATVHDSAGNSSDTTTARMGWIRDATIAANVTRIGRAKFVFDLSAVSGTVTAASFSLYLTASYTIGGTSPTFNVYSAPAGAVSNTDYTYFGSTAYCDTAKSYATISGALNQYHTWTLNATGISAINSAVGSTFYIGGREATYDAANTNPNKTTTDTITVIPNMGDDATNKPKLTLTIEVSAFAPPLFFN